MNDRGALFRRGGSLAALAVALGWRISLSPADADVLVVCGTAGPELTATVERIWEQLRDDFQAREGDGFDIRAFHRRALDIGGVGLDTLRAALLG